VGIYFTGDAPGPDDFAAASDDDNLTIYYLPGTTGWGSTFAGRPAVLWNPLIQVGDGGFGVRDQGFSFNIAGTKDIPIVVEASTSLATGVWAPLLTITLPSGLVPFRDPDWTNYPNRFYRIHSP